MSKISDLVACATKDELGSCDDYIIGKIFNAQAQSIAAITGVSVRGLNKVITAYAVRHTIKFHGNDKSERERNQIGVTNEDFELIPEILLTPDVILKGKIERGKQSILFIKKLKCYYHVAMIIEGKRGSEQLTFRTMYKSNVNKKADV